MESLRLMGDSSTDCMGGELMAPSLVRTSSRADSRLREVKVVGYNSVEIARGYSYAARGGGLVGHLRRQQDSATRLEGLELRRIGS